MIVLKILVCLICALGVIFIYDARTIVENFFSSSETIKTIKTVKIIGTAMSVAGLIILYIIK